MPANTFPHELGQLETESERLAARAARLEGEAAGITADLPPSAQVVIVVLMFVGRVGTITVATALAVGRLPRPYRFPKENLIVG